MTPTRDEVQRRFPATADLSESDRHRVLASERRRLTLEALSEHSTPVDLADLADEVARREAAAGETVDADRVALTLHHVHLPELAGSGVVEYDPDERRVLSCPPDPPRE